MAKPEQTTSAVAPCLLCGAEESDKLLCPSCEIDIDLAIDDNEHGHSQPLKSIVDTMDEELRQQYQQLRREADAAGLDLGPLPYGA